MPSKGGTELLSTLAMVGQLGLIMVACVVGGFMAGVYLDRWLGTGPVLTIILLLAGIGGGMLTVYQLAMSAVKADSTEKDGRNAPNSQ